MSTYRMSCSECGNVWTALEAQLKCPNCVDAKDERRSNHTLRAWVEKQHWKERKLQMYGKPVSDKAMTCEACGMGMKGYCGRDYDEVSGSTYIVCDCGHRIEVWEKASRWDR